MESCFPKAVEKLNCHKHGDVSNHFDESDVRPPIEMSDSEIYIYVIYIYIYIQMTVVKRLKSL